ncbi:MAG: DNA/RNA nuclease SfsA [Armatimonadetes bacterium]|nr:DNA/RNA nuclease SfsA [Armatimonadota bacterium]
MNLPRPLEEGTLVRRLNRFAAQVRVGRGTWRVHVPNTGRLGELLVEGARVYIHPVADARRATRGDLLLVRHGRALVSVDSRAPAAIAAEAFLSQTVPPLRGVTEVVREVSFGRGRIDLCVRAESEEWLVEVKGCTLVRGGVAIFPDAPTERGRRHVEELAAFAAQGGRAMVLFVIQRSDAHRFRANHETDPRFAGALADAAAAGVVIRAHTCRVTQRRVTLGPAAPVTLHPTQ